MQRHDLPNYLTFARHVPQQNSEDCDEMDLELFSSPESNSLSILTDNEDLISESTEDGSYITTKSDTFSLIHQNNSLTESQSTEDTESRKDEEIDDFYTTTNDREVLFIEQSDENEENWEAEDMDSNEAEDGSEAEENDSNANTLEESSILQGFIRMDEGLTQSILFPDQWNFWEPLETIIEEQSTITTTDDENPTLVREKEQVLQMYTEQRASIWDCCGFWSLFHVHKGP